jgi:hypothetical protein
MATVDNTLEFIDQASFLGLRALGHGPLIQFTWIYRNGVDLEALRQFQRNLGHGLLGRRIECSPLPFGRHRWISWPGPADIEVAAGARPAREITAWTDEQAALPVDPERGPSWRLAVQPLIEGGAAVTLLVSHTVADGVGIALAVADAAKGITRHLGYPAGGERTRSRALREDSRRFCADLPRMARAVVSAVQLARNTGLDSPPAAPKSKSWSGRELASQSVTMPSVTVRVDLDEWDRRAAELGGTSTSLALGFSARLGRRLGWVSPDGSVTLSVPVNERAEGDTRGNALTVVRLTVDPDTVCTDLTGLRAGLKQALSTLAQARNDLVAPLPLTPLVPKSLARRFEGLVGGTAVIGCSNLGNLDPAVNRPDGSEADDFAVRMAERIPRDHLRRFGGSFFPAVSGRVHGKFFISVAFCDADASTTREDLRATAESALGDFDLNGTIA